MELVETAIEFWFILLEIKYKTNTVTIEPKIEEIEIFNIGKKTIAIAVKSVVPLAIPKVYGVISSFLKIIWKINPPKDKIPPTKKANKTLETLKSQKTIFALFVESKTSFSFNVISPKNGEIARIIRAKIYKTIFINSPPSDYLVSKYCYCKTFVNFHL